MLQEKESESFFVVVEYWQYLLWSQEKQHI